MARRAVRAALVLTAFLIAIALSGRFDRLGFAGRLEMLGDEVPANGLELFQEEAVSLEGCTGIRVNEESSVVGWTERGSIDDVVSRRTRELTGKGWSCVPCGSSCATFTKEDGSLRWLFVSCFEISEEVSVVVQLAV